jgi:hypothetical protein
MFVTEEQQKQRLDICKKCEYLKKLDRCSKCGCVMSLKTKLKKAKCPIGKWGIILEEKL